MLHLRIYCSFQLEICVIICLTSVSPIQMEAQGWHRKGQNKEGERKEMEVCISHRAGPAQITWGSLLFLLGSLNKQPHLLPGERKDGKGRSAVKYW